MASTPQRDDVPDSPADFHTTHWTVVLTARDKESAGAQEALGNLCSSYWYPLYVYIRRQGINPHEAEDLTQEFFHRLLQKEALAHVRPAAGKFRSFLIACLKNFLANEREHSSAQRRGGGRALIALDGLEAETRYALEPAEHRTPEAEFERQWAWELLEQTLKELEREYSTARKSDLFDDLKGFLPGGQENGSRADLAAKRGVSVGAIDVAIHRLRQRFGMLLRHQVAQTVSSDKEVDEELHYLGTLLGP
jgi:RNA polymerase sigma-70 factor (ECF subfamily)